jgi:hypothetical protein
MPSRLFVRSLAIGLFLPVFAAANDSRIEKSEPWSRIQQGEYLIENNVWNTSAMGQRAWRQAIFTDPATGAMGWRWDFDAAADDVVFKSYPQIIYGQKAYAAYTSTTSRLPAPLAGLRVRFEYDYRIEAMGRYNLSTDITFTDKPVAAEKHTRAKLMIWLETVGVEFFPGRTKRLEIGGQMHDAFIDPQHDGADGRWTFIALRPLTPVSRGSIAVHDYIDALIALGALRPGWYLSSVEIGSEIATGRGEVLFRRFAVSVESPPATAGIADP